MSKSERIAPLGATFEIKDYVDSAGDAAIRTRTISVVLVIACVLIFIGFWNSLHSSWAVERLRAVHNTESESIFGMLQSDNFIPDNDEKAAYRDALRKEVVRGYVDNVRFIKLPFFGIAIDVNDLGIIGGLSLIIIMLTMRFSLSREIKNLNVSFRESLYHDRLSQFYHTLAMRQVFTVPEMMGESVNLFLSIAPKLVCLLPAFVITLAAGYDFHSIFNLRIYNFWEVGSLLVFETVVLVPAIWWISLVCLERQFHIDEIWSDYWELIDSGKPAAGLLDKNYKKSGELKKILKRRLYEYKEAGNLFKRLLQHITRYRTKIKARSSRKRKSGETEDKTGEIPGRTSATQDENNQTKPPENIKTDKSSD
jgi:hypothetical protein